MGAGLHRRDVISGLGALLLAPAQAAAQKVPLIGILVLGTPDPTRFLAEFRGKLRELGYTEGGNIRVEVRNAEGQAARLAPLARELVAMGLDVLVPYQTPAVTAAKAATSTIPIIMASVADPVGAGFVRSLSQPGGNITGVTGATEQLAGKNLELMKQIIPSARVIGMLANDADPFHRTLVARVQEAAASLRLEAKVVLTRAGDDFDAHLAAMKRAGAAAVLVQPTLPLSQVAAAAAKNKLPAFCPSANFVAEGGLIGYAADLAVLHTQAAALVDKVLKGRKPAELPVEFTTKFHLSVNMKAAKAIGLEISPALLNIADEVIE